MSDVRMSVLICSGLCYNKMLKIEQASTRKLKRLFRLRAFANKRTNIHSRDRHIRRAVILSFIAHCATFKCGKENFRSTFQYNYYYWIKYIFTICNSHYKSIVCSKHYTLVNEVEFMFKYVAYMDRTGESNGKLIIDLSCAILLFFFFTFSRHKIATTFNEKTNLKRLNKNGIKWSGIFRI